MRADDWRSEYYRQIDDCEHDRRSSLLTAWECDFLESIRGQLDGGRALSTKQIGLLDSIWEKATARG